MQITIKNLQKKIPVYPKRIKRAILKTLTLQGVRKPADLTFCFVSDRKIAELNRKFLHKNSATDVLAFDLSERRGKIIADIVISAETAARNSKVFKTSVAKELDLYVIHGLLHIFGYKDHSLKHKIRMFKKQQKICQSIKQKP